MKKTIYLFCLLIAVTSLQAQQYDHCGTWRWSLKTLTDNMGEEILASTPEKTTINTLNALKTAALEQLYADGFAHGDSELDHSGLFVELARRNGMG